MIVDCLLFFKDTYIIDMFSLLPCIYINRYITYASDQANIAYTYEDKCGKHTVL